MISTDLERTRKHLHQHPELSGNEHQTKTFISEWMQQHCPSAHPYPVASTGLLFHFEGTENAPVVLLRCELDALPIQESNGFEHRSTTNGVSHKCGHDGHMVILLSVALELEKMPPRGSVFLLFQPAEENGEGAIAVWKDATFQNLVKADYVFALHNIPGEALHSIHIKPLESTPSVISATVDFHGKTSHAAEPQHGFNPAYFLGELELYCQSHNQCDPNLDGFQIVTPIFAEIGSRDFGISAGNGSAGFTLRTKDNESMERLKTDFTRLLDHLSGKYNIPYDLHWSHAFSSIFNHEECVELVTNAAESLSLDCTVREAPFPWGEDFGVFTEHFKGALFGLGSGTSCSALHNPDYDFPDALIPTGRDMFLTLIKRTQS